MVVISDSELDDLMQRLKDRGADCYLAANAVYSLRLERDLWRSRALSLFWKGHADDVTAGKVREAAAEIDNMLRSPPTS